jgi:phosphatidylserine/phosphatidylglycerophosphate/cardiolipin synthase-like enzyme
MILNGIRSAEKSIIVAAYSFTSRPISAALLEAHKRGVNVRVIADAKSNTSRNQHSAVMSLASQGIPVRVNDRYAILHHKFMVFDGRHVQTGSFNYSAAAVDRNAENVLILWNLPEMAEIYTREWQRLWNESKEVTR